MYSLQSLKGGGEKMSIIHWRMKFRKPAQLWRDREHPHKEENVFVPINDTVCYSALFLHLLAPRSTQSSWKKEVETAYTRWKTLFASSTTDSDSLKTKQPFFIFGEKKWRDLYNNLFLLWTEALYYTIIFKPFQRKKW